MPAQLTYVLLSGGSCGGSCGGLSVNNGKLSSMQVMLD